jgi:SAM-dependent methyltransferase
MISGYFHDMAWNIQEIARVLKPGGFAAYVVGNCRFSGVHVEVDAILAQIGESFGLDVEEILIAKTRGSSAQQVRKYGDLPLRESIVVFRKPVK